MRIFENKIPQWKLTETEAELDLQGANGTEKVENNDSVVLIFQKNVQIVTNYAKRRIALQFILHLHNWFENRDAAL